MAWIKGRRIYPDADGKLKYQPGDYGREADGTWMCRPPNPDIWLGNLERHTVEEHADGTITVRPSILIRQGDDKSWHGYLKNGFFEEC